MQDDLAALKKGQPPAGFKIEKESEKEAKRMPEVAVPKVTPPPPAISHVELGKLEKAKPITVEVQKSQEAGKMPIPSPLPSLSKPTINIPPMGGLLGGLTSKKPLIRIIVILVIAIGVVLGFIALRGSKVPQITTTPTPTLTPRTPTVTPVSIEGLFPSVDILGIPLGANFTTRFINSVRTDILLSSREPAIYGITSVDGTEKYSLTEFTSGTSTVIPDNLKSLVYDKSLLLTLLYESDNKIGFGFIVKLQDPNAVNEITVVLQSWESAMAGALASLFQFDQSKAASVGFLDNTYNDVAIRYRNFPDPGSTIDYAVFKAKNGESYLIIVNSREHVYKIIDKLK